MTIMPLAKRNGHKGDHNLVSKPKMDPAGIADRALKALRGHRRSDIFARSGISKNTLARVLRGEQVKRSTLLALADACAVSAEWLLNGTGEMALPPPAGAPPPPPPPAQPIDSTPDPHRIDLRRLGAAMRIAGRHHAAPVTAEDWIEAARDMIAIYELLGDYAGLLTPDDDPLRPS